MKFVSDLQEFYNPTECVHILEDVNSASCNAATWFLGLASQNGLFSSLF
jgi:hypothetical protein